MVKQYSLAVVATVLLFCVVFSQSGNTKADSLEAVIKKSSGKQKIEGMNALSWEIKYNNPERALSLSHQALEQAKELNDDNGKMIAFRNLSGIKSIQGETKNSVYYADSALDYAIALNDTFQQAKIYNILAIGYRKSNEISKALMYQDSALVRFKLLNDSIEIIGNLHNEAVTYEIANDNLSAFELYKKVLDFEQRNDNPTGICRTAVQMGIIAYKNGDLFNAIRYHKMALKNARKINNKRYEASALNDLGSVYIELDSNLLAIDYFKQALEINSRYGFKDYQAINLSNLGEAYKENNLAKAKRYYEKATAIQKDVGLTRGYILDVINLAEVNRRYGNVDSAKKLLNRALSKSDSLNYAKGLRDAYYELYQLSKGSGLYNEALAYHENYISWKDSIRNIEHDKYLTGLQAKYDFQKMQKENAKLQVQNQLQETENWQQKISLIVVVFISVFIFIIALIFYMSRKKMMRLNRLLEFQQKEIREQKKALENALSTKDKFFSIIAHDLKNPFMGIMGFADLLKEKVQESGDEELKSYANYIYSSSRDLFQLLENLLKWSKAQQDDCLIEIEDSLNLKEEVQQAVNQISWAAKEKDVQIVNEIPDDIHVQSDKNVLNSVVRNLVNNAVKYSYAGSSVVIGKIDEEDKVIVFVKDSGVGMNEAIQKNLFEIVEKTTMPGTNHEKGSGLGLALCKEFIEKQGDEIWFESNPGRGSIFYFSLYKSA